MKPLLPALIAGIARRINLMDQTAMARYFALKCAVVDWSNSNPLIYQEDREAIAAGRLPDSISIDLYFCGEDTITPGYTQSAARLYRYGFENPPGPNVRAITLRFGKAVVFAFYSRQFGIEADRRATRLHPASPSEIQWPLIMSLPYASVLAREAIINPGRYSGQIIAEAGERLGDVSPIFER